ncbi:MAG TPA: hypothetical protein VFH51_09530 [Myxococcota bacterium]|nr:hypothetical protein [Myxococcota bacterium]
MSYELRAAAGAKGSLSATCTCVRADAPGAPAAARTQTSRILTLDESLGLLKAARKADVMGLSITSGSADCDRGQVFQIAGVSGSKTNTSVISRCSNPARLQGFLDLVQDTTASMVLPCGPDGPA